MPVQVPENRSGLNFQRFDASGEITSCYNATTGQSSLQAPDGGHTPCARPSSGIPPLLPNQGKSRQEGAQQAVRLKQHNPPLPIGRGTPVLLARHAWADTQEMIPGLNRAVSAPAVDAKFRAPLAGRPIQDFGRFHQGSSPDYSNL